MTPHQLIKQFGSASAAARALGLSKQAIHNWKRKGKIPTVRQAWIREQLQGNTK